MNDAEVATGRVARTERQASVGQGDEGLIEQRRMGAREWAALALIMAVGVALRTIAIGRESLWADEALTYVIAQAPPLALATMPLDPTAPLYYWLHILFVPDGASALVGRSIALVAGVLAIPAAFFLGRSMIGRSAALFVAVWVAVAAPLVDYSQEARAYSLLVLVILLSALALHVALTSSGKRRRRALVGLALTLILGLYTHFIAVFWIVPALLILRVDAGRGRQPGAVRDAWLVAGATILAGLPEAVRVVRYATGDNRFQWLQQPDLAGLAKIVAEQWIPFGATLLAPGALIAVLLLAFRGRTFLVNWAGKNCAAAFILAALLLQPLAVWAFGFLVSPVVMPRTILPSIPAVGLLIALLIDPLKFRNRVAAGVAVAGLALAATLIGGTMRAKEDWEGAATALKSTQGRGADLVIACPYWKAPALMAATRGGGSTALAAQIAGQMRLIETRLGREKRWDRLYFDRVYWPNHAAQLGIAVPPDRTAGMAVSSVGLVMSECSSQERAAIMAWMGPARLEDRWSAPAVEDHAGIVVERWTFDAPRTLHFAVTR